MIHFVTRSLLTEDKGLIFKLLFVFRQQIQRKTNMENDWTMQDIVPYWNTEGNFHNEIRAMMIIKAE